MAEQSVKGLDTLDERAIQAILSDGLRQHHEVAREVHYPSCSPSSPSSASASSASSASSLSLSGAVQKLTHRRRCDLVLTLAGRSFERALDDALWLEVKVATQLSPLGGRHSGYTARWHSVVRDVRKMTDAPGIRHAALVLVAFTESESILHQDLDTFETLLVRQQVLAGFRHVRTLPIADRIGHRFCSVAVWPTPLPSPLLII
jgi:hypothetical protein